MLVKYTFKWIGK